MKQITKLRHRQPYFFISGILLLLILLITWFFESYFAEILFMDYDAPDLTGSAEENRRAFLSSILTWEVYIDGAMRYVVNVFPLFAVFPVIPFARERDSYFVLGGNRFGNYTKELIKSICYYTLKGGGCIGVVFVIYFTLGMPIMINDLDSIGGFLSAFPEGFYPNHPYLVFLIMAITIYFGIGIVFALIACGISLFTTKELYIIGVPLVIYIGFSYFGEVFNLLPFKISQSVVAFNTTYTTGETFVPLIPLLAIGLALSYVGLRRRKNGIDI